VEHSFPDDSLEPRTTPQDLAPDEAQPSRVRPAVPPGAREDARAVAAAAPVPMPVPAPLTQERRRASRQTLVARASLQAESDPGAVATGFLSNISEMGVGLHTRRALAVGEKFHMRIELGPLNWATRLRVVSCRAHDSGTYDVGAEFVAASLPDRVQLELAA